jgi:hypothetical protein
MSRTKGSTSTKDSKQIAVEIQQLQGSPYKYNFDFLRLVETLICYKVTESICNYPLDTPLDEMEVTTEIPLIGNVTIKPRTFHEKHRLTEAPSLHLDFEFEPCSGFKTDIYKAFLNRETDLPKVFATLYSDRLKELYSRLESEG